MTLGMSWIRSVGKTKELVFAIDSRLNCGRRWDGCPKLLMLPRSDSILCFAGDTDDAYPLMLQIGNAISMFPKAQSGATDITDLKGHMLRVFEDMRKHIFNLPRGQNNPSDTAAEFVFGGYSWKEKDFRFWRIREKNNHFFAEPPKNWSTDPDKKLIHFVGDKEAVKEVQQRIAQKLKDNGKQSSGDFDMEPFEALRDIIREGVFSTVGGPPQLVKVYQNMNSVPFAVYWPDRASNKVSVLGRTLLDYEITNWPVIDPDNIRFRMGEIVTPRLQKERGERPDEQSSC